MPFLIRLTVSLAAAALAASCGERQPIASAEADLVEAIRAAETGRSEDVLRSFDRIRRTLRSRNSSCHQASDVQHLYTKLLAAAIFNSSAPTEVSAVQFLSDTRGIYSTYAVFIDPANCTRQAPSLESAQRVVEASALRACQTIAAEGPNEDALVGVSLRRINEFSCQLPDSAYDRNNEQAASDEIGLISCDRFMSGSSDYRERYLQDVRARGLPAEIRVSQAGFQANWPDGFYFFASGNPNLIRRAQGHYPSENIVHAMTENHNGYFTDSAANRTASACLSEYELSTIIVGHVNRLDGFE